MKKNLTIVYIINELSEYFDLSIHSMIDQTVWNYDIVVLDKQHLTKFEDAIYVSSENEAIATCETPYIYFMTDKDLLKANFVSHLNSVINSKYSDIYAVNVVQDEYDMIKTHYTENVFCSSIKDLLCTHSIYNKIYRVEFLKDNKIGFSAKTYSEVLFNYITLIKADAIYNLDKDLVLHLYSDIIGSDFFKYKEIIELAKKNVYLAQSKYKNRILQMLKTEDSYINIGNKGETIKI